MTQCKMRDKPFDDPTHDRCADTTSGNWVSRLHTNVRSKEGKSDTRLTES